MSFKALQSPEKGAFPAGHDRSNGKLLVDMYNLPSSTLFFQLFCEQKASDSLRILRDTETDMCFGCMRRIEDVWAGHSSDDESLHSTDGKVLSWIGVTK